MKCGLVLFIGLAAMVAGDGEWKPAGSDEDVQVYREKCIKEISLSKQQLEKIDNFEFPNEKEIHEYALCMVKNVGLFTEGTGFDRDRLVKQLQSFSHKAPSPIPIKGFLSCVDNTVGWANEAEQVYLTIKCMWNHIYELREQHKQALTDNKEYDSSARTSFTDITCKPFELLYAVKD